MSDAEAMEWWLAMAADAEMATLTKGRIAWWAELDWGSGPMTFGKGEDAASAIRECHRKWQRDGAA